MAVGIDRLPNALTVMQKMIDDGKVDSIDYSPSRVLK